MNEADTCRKYVVPRLQTVGGENEPHCLTEQKSFTDGRILIVGSKARDPRAEVRLRHQRPRHRRVRLHDRVRARGPGFPVPGRPLGTPPRGEKLTDEAADRLLAPGYS